MAQREIVIRGIYIDDVSPNLVKSGATIKTQTAKSKKDIEAMDESFEVLKKSSKELGEEIKASFDTGTSAIKRFSVGSRGIFNDIGTMIGRMIKSFAMMALGSLALKMAVGGLLLVFKNMGPTSNPFLIFLRDATRSMFLFIEKILLSNKYTADWGIKLAEMVRKPLFEKATGSLKGWTEWWAKAKANLTGVKEKVKEATEGIDGLGKATNGANKFFAFMGGAIGKLSAPLKAFEGVLSFVSKSIVGIAVGLAAFLVAVVAIKKISALTAEFTKLGNEIYQNSIRVGLSTQAYQNWGFALSLVGSSVDELVPAISKLQKTAVGAADGTDNASKSFRALGISAKDTNGAFKSGQVLFEETMIKLSEMTDITKRNALAQDIFGESANKLNPILSKGSAAIKELVNDGGKYSVMTDKAIAGSVMMSKASAEVGLSFKKMGSSLVEGLIPRLASVLQGMQESGFLDFLENLAIAGGKLISVLFIPIQKNLEVLSVIFAATRMDINGFVFAIAKALSTIANILPNLVVPRAAKESMRAFADSFGADLDKSVSDYEKTVARLKRLNPKVDVLGSTVSTPDKIKEDDKKKETVEKSESAVNNVIEKINIDRLAIIDKYNEISIGNMSKVYDKRRALIIYNADKENYELEKAILFGEVREDEAAEYRKALARQTSLAILEVDKDEDKAREESDNKLKKSLEDINYSYIAVTQGQRKADFKKQSDEIEKWHTEQVILFADNKDAMNQIEMIYSDKKIQLVKSTEQQICDLQLESMRTQMDMFATWGQQVTQLGTNIADIEINQIERRRDSDIKALEAQGYSAEYSAKKREEINAEYDQKVREEKKKQQKWAIASAIISGGVAVMGAWENAMKLGYPANIIAGIISSGLITGLTIAEVGTISSQNFAKGGVVQGNKALGDAQRSMLTAGEVVLNDRQQGNLLMRLANNPAQSASIRGGDTYVTIQGNADEAILNTALRRSRQSQMQDMKMLLREMQYTGVARIQVA